MSEILNNIYINGFLLLTFAKYILYSIADLQPLYSELYFLILSGDRGNFCFFLKKMFSKPSYILLFFIQKPLASINQE